MFTRKILVDIDALFDTRLGLILERFPEKYNRLDLEIYRKRISEVIFSMVGIEEWDELWAGRDVKALMQSQPTELLMGELLRVLESERHSAAMMSPTEVPELTLNIYPYRLSTAEQSEMVRQMHTLFPGFQIKIGRWCEKGLNPTVLRRGWDAWFTYDFYRWLNANGENLKNRIPNFVIYRPALLTSDVTDETSKMIQNDGVNPFTESKKFLAEYVTAEPLDAGLFSLATEFN